MFIRPAASSSIYDDPEELEPCSDEDDGNALLSWPRPSDLSSPGHETPSEDPNPWAVVTNDGQL